MIHRSEHEDNFTVISTEVIRDSRLSDGAKCLLLFMLSMSDDWDFNMRGLATCLDISVSSVNSRVVELEKAGYISIKKKRSKGRFVSCTWDIYEKPHSKISEYDLSEYGSPEYGKTALRKTEQLRNTKSKEISIERNTNRKKDSFVVPSVEQVRAYCEERSNSVDPETFVDFYTSKGWKVGKDPMKDWKAAVRTWEKRRKSEPKKSEPFDLEAWAEQEQVKRNGLKTSLEDCE